jgi:hypothetical protein
MNYEEKYLKYKTKYLITKNNKTLKMHGGMKSYLKTEADVLKLGPLHRIDRREFQVLDEKLKEHFFEGELCYYKRLTIGDINKLEYIQIITSAAYESITGPNKDDLQKMFIPYNYTCRHRTYSYAEYLGYQKTDLCIPNEYIKKLSIGDLDKLEPLYEVSPEIYEIFEPEVKENFTHINEPDVFEALYRLRNQLTMITALANEYFKSFYRKKLRSEDIAKLKPLTLLYKTEYNLLNENDKKEFQRIERSIVLYDSTKPTKQRIERITFYRKKFKSEEVSTLRPWDTLYSEEIDNLPSDKKNLINKKDNSIILTSENISKMSLFRLIDNDTYEKLEESEKHFFTKISNSEYMCNRQPIDDAELSDEIYGDQWDILNKVWKDKYDKKDRKYIKKTTFLNRFTRLFR